jgi:hypothetical protein
VVILLFGLCADAHGQSADPDQGKQKVLKAAIVDHLSISAPNAQFVSQAKSVLSKAGYSVDYFKGEEVTVEFYRDLPTHGFDIILLRAHSAYIPKYLSLAIFTSEPYTKHRYVYEQLRNRVAAGYIQPYKEGDPKYLVITDKFVRYSMKGSFNGAVVIMMGCTGVKKCAAAAFAQKGVGAYIGWTGSVLANHTDRATLFLLRQLLENNETIANGTMNTMKHVGRDPKHNSTLLFWPIRSANKKVTTRAGTETQDSQNETPSASSSEEK